MTSLISTCVRYTAFTRNNPEESHYKLYLKLVLMNMTFESEIYSLNRFLSIRNNL